MNDKTAAYALRFLEATKPGESEICDQARASASLIAFLRMREYVQVLTIAARAQEIAREAVR